MYLLWQYWRDVFEWSYWTLIVLLKTTRFWKFLQQARMTTVKSSKIRDPFTLHAQGSLLERTGFQNVFWKFPYFLSKNTLSSNNLLCSYPEFFLLECYGDLYAPWSMIHALKCLNWPQIQRIISLFELIIVVIILMIIHYFKRDHTESKSWIRQKLYDLNQLPTIQIITKQMELSYVKISPFFLFFWKMLPPPRYRWSMKSCFCRIHFRKYQVIHNPSKHFCLNMIN